MDLRRTQWLDVSDDGTSTDGKSACGVVHIPFRQLPARVAELPARGEALHVLNTGDEAAAAVGFLESTGRRATLCDRESFLRSGGDGGAAAADLESHHERIGWRLWSPTPFVEQAARRRAVGRALDLGCGVGRDAVFLAAAGCRVTAIDRLPDALDRGRALLARYAPEAEERVEWRCADLRDEHALSDADGPFDLIIMARYLDRALLSRVARMAAANAELVIETFGPAHAERLGRRRGCGVATLEELRCLPGWRAEQCEEVWHAGAGIVRLLARRDAQAG
ncbi:MAG: class I SAM-dependent methyltransferase [Phycisphaerae bacterium]|nr:class I SAM-dependent methyltransferase [Phycisphaerae bacterium]